MSKKQDYEQALNDIKKKQHEDTYPLILESNWNRISELSRLLIIKSNDIYKAEKSYRTELHNAFSCSNNQGEKYNIIEEIKKINVTNRKYNIK